MVSFFFSIEIYAPANKIYSTLLPLLPSISSGICCSHGLGYVKIETDSGIAFQSSDFTSAYIQEFGTCPESPPPLTDHTASFDSYLRVPKCADVGLSCSSDNIIARAGKSEPYYSSELINSLDGCTDGTSSTYPLEESIELITVKTVKGGQLAEGARVEVSADVHVYQDGSEDTVDFFYTNSEDLTNPTWTWVASKVPSSKNDTTLSAQYTLPAGEMQAVRVNIRWRGSTQNNACSGGSYDDIDDLVFAVAEGSAWAPAQAAVQPPQISERTFTCDTIDNEDRCTEDSSCRWFSKRFKKGCQTRRRPIFH